MATRVCRDPASEREGAFAHVPDECFVEVLLNLDAHELLTAAWVSKRWREAVRSDAIWSRTRFATTATDTFMRAHFTPTESVRADANGERVRCVRRIDSMPLDCWTMALDYLEPREGICYRLLRSISCLQHLRHPSIVPLVMVNVDKAHNKIQLFYGDSGTSLEHVLRRETRLPLAEARHVLRQVLEALAHCHSRGVAHRNLKPKYIILRKEEVDGVPAGGGAPLAGAPPAGEGGWRVTLNDFNSVRWLVGKRPSCTSSIALREPVHGAAEVLGNCSPTVVTQPYRAPEILLGSVRYSTAIDVWACGCVFAEMVSGQMLFVGDSDIGQLFKIFELLGTPGPSKARGWNGVEQLPHYNVEFPNMRRRSLREHPLTSELCVSAAAEDLLTRMLAFDPADRISAAEALAHPFFSEAVPDAALAVMPPPTPPAKALTPLAVPGGYYRGESQGGATTAAASSCTLNAATDPAELRTPIPKVAEQATAHALEGAAEAAEAAEAAAGREMPPRGAPETAMRSAVASAPHPVRTAVSAHAGCSTVHAVPCHGDDRERGDLALARVSGGWMRPHETRIDSLLSPARAKPKGQFVGAHHLPDVWDSWRERERIEPSRGKRTALVWEILSSQNELRGGWNGVSRAELVGWLLRVSTFFCKCERTVHLAVALFDRIIENKCFPALFAADGHGALLKFLCKTEGYGLAALLLACKFQEVEIHQCTEFTDYLETRHQSDILELELEICVTLRFDFALPTALDFLFCLLERVMWPSLFPVHRGSHQRPAALAYFFCELSLLRVPMAHQSRVACASLCLALACLRCGLWHNGVTGAAATATCYWPSSLEHATGYSRAQLSTEVNELEALHQKAFEHISVERPSPSIREPTISRVYGPLERKFSQDPFLGVIHVKPFKAHAGGQAICSD